MKNIFKIKNFVFDIIFPIQCLGCKKNIENLKPEKRWICPDCFGKIKIKENQVCPVCEQFSVGGKTHYRCKKEISLDGIWIATEYNYEIVSEAIHKFKFNFIKDISFILSEILIKSILQAREYDDFQDLILINFSQKSDEEKIYIDENKNQFVETIIIPVPLHKKRYNWRGFNQSFLLSKYIANRFKLEIYDDLLIRSKNTRPQSKIKSSKDRKENIKEAFSFSKNIDIDNFIRNKNVIIIDDVCTTSATLNECAKKFRKFGAKKIWGLVVARR